MASHEPVENQKQTGHTNKQINRKSKTRKVTECNNQDKTDGFPGDWFPQFKSCETELGDCLSAGKKTFAEIMKQSSCGASIG